MRTKFFHILLPCLVLVSCRPGPALKYVLTYESLGLDRTEYTTDDASSVPGFKVKITSSSGNGAKMYRAFVSNDNPDYVIKGFRGPFIEDIKYRIEEYNIVFPRGLGQLFRKTPPANKHKRIAKDTEWTWIKEEGVFRLEGSHPNRDASMQWCAFASGKDGLYLASHDPLEKGKVFIIDYCPETAAYSFSIDHLFTCFPGQSYETPETRVMHFEGTWHKAADCYKEWFGKTFKTVRQPEWLKESSGMLLAITKQQNEEVIFDYPEFSTTLCDIAEDRGLDILGLYGWAHGGHDKLYPDYYPDPKRGTEADLKMQFKAIRERGLRSILYVNGQLMDEEGTGFWADTGRFAAMKTKEGELLSEKWRKYKDAPGREHGRACLAFKPWYERMLRLARMANDYGCDGIVYDQLACRGPVFCYADNHGHTVPALVVENERELFFHKLREEMDRINPDFLIMTEGMVDSAMDDVNIFHGCACGTYGPSQRAIEERLDGSASSTWFSEMYEYCFPGVIMTLRNPNPGTTRNLSNYALISHLKNEMECRYAPDKRFMKDKVLPPMEEYGNVLGVPDLMAAHLIDPKENILYHRRISDFQKKYSSLLRTGVFMDTQGFVFEPSHSLSMAKAFVDDGVMGVVVWNASLTEELSFSLSAPGWKLTGYVSPEQEMSIGDKLAPQSICMALFSRE